MSRVVAVIPARLGSSRFPGKPLAPILGRPMIEHVYRRTALSQSVDDVYIATCDDEIGRATEAFGGRWISTSPSHERASDRVAEAIRGLDGDLVVMVQGDEPMVTPGMIDAALKPMLEDPTLECVNLMKRIGSESELRDPNTVKVVFGLDFNALYFSREPIPTARVLGVPAIEAYRQVCVIPFRWDILTTYTALTPTPLERAESVDMMRLLEHGYRVRLVETQESTYPVDTPEDLKRVQGLMRDDPLTMQVIGEEIPDAPR